MAVFLAALWFDVSTAWLPTARRAMHRRAVGMRESAAGDSSSTLVTFTSNAAAYLDDVKEKLEMTDLLLRLGVRAGGGGDAGMGKLEYSYILDTCKAEDVRPDDHVDVHDDLGVRCVVAPEALEALRGVNIDYSDALVGGGFLFHNPNADKTCGCGRSFDYNA